MDPACGGGSFITPVVRHLVSKSVARGFSVEDACRTALKSVHGIEIDSGLATLSQSLLRNMLAREYGFTDTDGRRVPPFIIREPFVDMVKRFKKQSHG